MLAIYTFADTQKKTRKKKKGTRVKKCIERDELIS